MWPRREVWAGLGAGPASSGDLAAAAAACFCHGWGGSVDLPGRSPGGAERSAR